MSQLDPPIQPFDRARIAAWFAKLGNRRVTETTSARPSLPDGLVDAFRHTFADALHDSGGPNAIAASALHVLGNALGANRCVYVECGREGAPPSVLAQYRNPNQAGLDEEAPEGPWIADLVPTLDLKGDTLVDNGALRIRVADAADARGLARIIVPITDGHEPRAFLVVERSTRTKWAAQDISMAQIAAERLFAAVECGRAGAKLTHLEGHARAIEDAAREADVAREHLLAVLAHELRNPLGPIRTAVAVLRTGGTADPALMRCREVIERQVVQLARLLDDLLDVARLSRGRILLRTEPTWLRDVLDAAIEAARPLIDQKGHDLEVSVGETGIALHADRARLTQALGNLLLNAAKFTPTGGHIRVAAIGFNDRVEITVTDSGAGIVEHELDRVFEPFAHSDTKAAGIEGGLGLGLALARRFIEMHGGTLSASSAGLGLGSAFTVRLPRVTDAIFSDNGSPEGHATSRCRVLVADDNVDAADMLTALLRQQGHAVRTVYDGSAAIQEADLFRPHVAVLDLGLPGRTGLEVCAELRGRSWGTSMLILAATGWGRDEDHRRSVSAGFDLHLLKPIDPDELLGAIEAHRGGAQVTEQSER